MYLASEVVDFPLAVGGNASALELLCAWLMLDLATGAGNDPETDLFGVVAIAALLAAMPILEVTADAWSGPPAPRSAPSPGCCCRSAPRRDRNSPELVERPDPPCFDLPWLGRKSHHDGPALPGS